MSESVCPDCQSDVGTDFGLSKCPSCGLLLFIEVDGSVRKTEAEAQVESFDSAPSVPIESFESVVSTSCESVENDFSKQDESFNWENENLAEAEVFQENDQEEPVDKEDMIEEKGPETFQDIVDYANSEDSAGEDGPYYYNVHISGIHSSDIRERLIETLIDPRLGWSSGDINKKIQNGALSLKKLNPLSAHVVIRSIRDLPVEVSWKQISIIQGEA